MTAPRLLAGPDPMHGPERFRDHVSRLGPLPRGGHALIETLVRTGITGRGGADFPVGLKWRAVASARRDPPTGGRAAALSAPMLPIPPAPKSAGENIEAHDAIVLDAFSASPIIMRTANVQPAFAGYPSVVVPI